jgi:hypothetical protein
MHMNICACRLMYFDHIIYVCLLPKVGGEAYVGSVLTSPKLHVAIHTAIMYCTPKNEEDGDLTDIFQ